MPALRRLLEAEGLKTLIRAHEEEGDGYKFHMWNGPDQDPPCMTVFSAPNYCLHENDAAVFTANPGELPIVSTYYEADYSMYFVGSDRDRNYCAVALFFPLLCSYTMELMETLKIAMEQSD